MAKMTIQRWRTDRDTGDVVLDVEVTVEIGNSDQYSDGHVALYGMREPLEGVGWDVILDRGGVTKVLSPDHVEPYEGQ